MEVAVLRLTLGSAKIGAYLYLNLAWVSASQVITTAILKLRLV